MFVESSDDQLLNVTLNVILVIMNMQYCKVTVHVSFLYICQLQPREETCKQTQPVNRPIHHNYALPVIE